LDIKKVITEKEREREREREREKERSLKGNRQKTG